MADTHFATTTEVATYFSVDPSTVHRWIREGRLSAIKIGKDFRIERDSIEELVRKSRVAS